MFWLSFSFLLLTTIHLMFSHLNKVSLCSYSFTLKCLIGFTSLHKVMLFKRNKMDEIILLFYKSVHYFFQLSLNNLFLWSSVKLTKDYLNTDWSLWRKDYQSFRRYHSILAGCPTFVNIFQLLSTLKRTFWWEIIKIFVRSDSVLSRIQ